MTTEQKVGIGVLLLIGIGLYMKFGRIGAVVAKTATDTGSGGGGGGYAPEVSRMVVPSVMVADVSPVTTVSSNVAPPATSAPLTQASTATIKPTVPGGDAKPPTTTPLPKPAKPVVGKVVAPGVKLSADGYKWKSDYAE